MKTIGLIYTNNSLLLTKSLKSKISAFFSNVLSFQLRLIVLTGILTISTSYQTEDSCIGKISSEQFLPVFKADLNLRLMAVSNDMALEVMNNSLETSVLIKAFYALNGYKPAWTVNNYLTWNSREFIKLVERSRNYGLDMNSYNIRLIRKLASALQKSDINGDNIKLRQDFELLITDASFKFMIHLNRGLFYSDSDSATAIYINSLPGFLMESIYNSNLVGSILSLQPGNADYKRLQKALEKYLDKVSLNDTEYDIPAPERDPDNARIKTTQVLINLGYLAESDSDVDTLYKSALRDFQKFHGLEPDGKLDKNTRNALSKSTLYRYNQIALNLNRLRNEQNLGDTYIYVNIPSFKLRVIEKSEVRKVFNVIVGKPETPTPVMSSKIEKIITNPFWNVPKKITLYELLPQIKKDSMYLKRNRFKLMDSELNVTQYNKINWENVSADNFDYYIRQDASNANALGIIKFIFNNPYHIYLHDTPGKKLFTKNIRAFSHGCIRLQNPDQLAEYIVENNCCSQDNVQIKTLLERGTHREIEITGPLNIYIRYLTCEADDQNNIYFLNDIYTKDKEQMELLFN
jgi:murein L,D-transpeptidase YcbB/YkuD